MGDYQYAIISPNFSLESRPVDPLKSELLSQAHRPLVGAQLDEPPDSSALTTDQASMFGQGSSDMSMRRMKRPEHQLVDGTDAQVVQNRKGSLLKSSSTRTISETIHTQFPFPTIATTKTAHNLQLPSFDLLGIASPHPDRNEHHTKHVNGEDEPGTIQGSNSSFSNPEMSRTQCEHGNCKALGVLDALKIGVERGYNPSGCVLTLTPPAEEGPSLSWQSTCNPLPEVTTLAPTINLEGSSLGDADTPANAAAISDSGESNSLRLTQDSQHNTGTSANPANTASRSSNEAGEGTEPSSWLDQSIRALGKINNVPHGVGS